MRWLAGGALAFAAVACSAPRSTPEVLRPAAVSGSRGDAAAPLASASARPATPHDPSLVPSTDHWWCFSIPRTTDGTITQGAYARCMPSEPSCEEARSLVLAEPPELSAARAAAASKCAVGSDVWCATRPRRELGDNFCQRGYACSEFVPQYFCAPKYEGCEHIVGNVRRLLDFSDCSPGP